MLDGQDPYEIWERAKTPDAETYRKHVDGFVDNFVRKEHRDRWREFLVKRPKQLFSKSSKLHNHMDWEVCVLLKNEDAFVAQTKSGIYFDFHDEPKILTAEEAFYVGSGNDALFFVEVGKKAVFFFHEYENYLCKK
jgi:hypothetical protein